MRRCRRDAAGARTPEPGTHVRKILVMIPAGEVYDRDCVRWYRGDAADGDLDRYHNVGDSFVHDSSLKLLDYDVVDVVDIRSFDRDAIDEWNATCDACFLRGSNYLHPAMEWGEAGRIVEHLKMPVVAFGIGAQSPDGIAPVLSPETVRVLEAIAAHSATVGVRGAFTADVLKQLGIRNVRVIGCPTLFRRNDPQLRVETPPLDAIRRVAFTLRREVSREYARDIRRYLMMQRAVLLSLAARYELSVYTQGECEEKALVLANDARRERAWNRLLACGWLGDEHDPIRRLYATSLFYSDTVADHERFVREQDLVLGYRLHGNLMALAHGVPALYFTYDARTSEFAETFALPAFDVFDGGGFSLEALWHADLFEPFNRAYRNGYGVMRSFLDENGLAHRMRGEAKSEEKRNVA
jgi:hypothetical protein